VHWAGVVLEAIGVRQYPGAHSVILAVWLRSAKLVIASERLNLKAFSLAVTEHQALLKKKGD